METHRSMAEVISYSLIIMSKHILNYHKRNCLNLGELSDNSGNVNRIKDLQQYNPIYSQFFSSKCDELQQYFIQSSESYNKFRPNPRNRDG